MTETISERVIRVIVATQKLAAERVGEESTFRELGIDSLDGLNIVFALEEEFAVDISDEAVKEFTSVRDVVVGIEHLLALKDA